MTLTKQQKTKKHTRIQAARSTDLSEHVSGPCPMSFLKTGLNGMVSAIRARLASPLHCLHRFHTCDCMRCRIGGGIAQIFTQAVTSSWRVIQ